MIASSRLSDGRDVCVIPGDGVYVDGDLVMRVPNSVDSMCCTSDKVVINGTTVLRSKKRTKSTDSARGAKKSKKSARSTSTMNYIGNASGITVQGGSGTVLVNRHARKSGKSTMTNVVNNSTGTVFQGVNNGGSIVVQNSWEDDLSSSSSEIDNARGSATLTAPTKIVNLTPHDINVIASDDNDSDVPTKTFKAHGSEARMTGPAQSELGTLMDGVPVRTPQVMEKINWPDIPDGTDAVIVSMAVGLAVRALPTDKRPPFAVYGPDTSKSGAVRDAAGKIVGTRNLVLYAAQSK